MPRRPHQIRASTVDGLIVGWNPKTKKCDRKLWVYGEKLRRQAEAGVDINRVVGYITAVAVNPTVVLDDDGEHLYCVPATSVPKPPWMDQEQLYVIRINEASRIYVWQWEERDPDDPLLPIAARGARRLR